VIVWASVPLAAPHPVSIQQQAARAAVAASHRVALTTPRPGRAS
jgi:hypothetical protein